MTVVVVGGDQAWRGSADSVNILMGEKAEDISHSLLRLCFCLSSSLQRALLLSS